jgi:hypothetical protein
LQGAIDEMRRITTLEENVVKMVDSMLPNKEETEKVHSPNRTWNREMPLCGRIKREDKFSEFSEDVTCEKCKSLIP